MLEYFLLEELVGQDDRVWYHIYALPYFNIDESIVGFASKVILINEQLWDDFDWQMHVFKKLHKSFEYLACRVLTSLIQRILALTRYAVLVVTLCGYLMRFFPTMILTLGLVYAVCGPLQYVNL